MRNPFRPSPGGRPPELIGRSEWLDEFTDNLLDGPGAPGRISLVTGRRGTGKTVLLTEMGKVAREYGWLVVEESGEAGVLDRLISRLEPDRPQVIGVNLNAIGGVQFAHNQSAVSLRDVLTDALTKKFARGVLITIDEVQGAPIEEMRSLALIVQHLVREDLNIALCLAGLPRARSLLLNDEVLTFLRRAYRLVLSELPIGDVEDSFREIFAEHGKAISSEQLSSIAQATYGYPYMVQLVGYHVWRASGLGGVTDGAIEKGVAVARERLGDAVYLPATDDLTGVELAFLMAMSQDDQASRTSEIAERLGKSPQMISNYRVRLVDSGVLVDAGRGLVDFALPGLRDWLRSHQDQVGALIEQRRV